MNEIPHITVLQHTYPLPMLRYAPGGSRATSAQALTVRGTTKGATLDKGVFSPVLSAHPHHGAKCTSIQYNKGQAGREIGSASKGQEQILRQNDGPTNKNSRLPSGLATSTLSSDASHSLSVQITSEVTVPHSHEAKGYKKRKSKKNLATQRGWLRQNQVRKVKGYPRWNPRLDTLKI
ncbi:hypothetical protein VTK56DRAFT_2463 [Thermocarpiscus australiensis]